MPAKNNMPKTLQILNPKPINNICNITFIIGNGFDLGLNMKTHYKDIYNEYIKTPSKSVTISNFKKELKDNKNCKYKNWSDFEIGMADYAKTLKSETELIECVRDFKSFMVQFLKNENERIKNLITTSDPFVTLIELGRSLKEFHKGLIPNDARKIDYLLNNEKCNINFITFNYTTVLETLLHLTAKTNLLPIYMPIENPVHIHGQLEEDVVLGIDNIEQLHGAPFSLSTKGKRAFVKTFFNEQFDKERVNKAKKIIAESSIICTYGFSFGESDKTWVNELVNWLIAYSDHHLVVYQHDETKYASYNSDEKMDVEDDKKEKLLALLSIKTESLLSQIHIPIGHDIFNFLFKKITPAKL